MWFLNIRILLKRREPTPFRPTGRGWGVLTGIFSSGSLDALWFHGILTTGMGPRDIFWALN